MSITVNGATNTITAASGLAIAGNTAVTGTLSATGNISTAKSLRFTASALGTASDYYISNYLTNVIYNAPTGGGHVWDINNGDKMTLSSTALTLGTGVGMVVADTTDATSTTAASLKTAGGLAVAKKLYVGDNIVMASGKGIDFSATANGSGTTTSEVLSDYEVGTWTPVVYGSTGAGTLTYTTQYGTYTKIGNTVHVTFSITVNAVSVGATGTILISGLPFSTSNDSASYRAGGSVSNMSGLQVNGTAPFVELAQNNTIFTLYGFNNNAAFGASDASSIGAGDFLNGSITYKSA